MVVEEVDRSEVTEKKRPLKDPPVRRNGKCARPGCTKDRLPNSGALYKAFEDPFCSSECCRIYWGCALKVLRPGDPSVTGS